jgi:predicted 3-demethylubiquinone-9 3-methyltransferase (glyoxalase superfamily)
MGRRSARIRPALLLAGRPAWAMIAAIGTRDRRLLMRATPFLMFQGEAEAAMRLYVSLFPDAEIEDIALYGAEEPGPEGSVRLARFRIAGQSVMCIDSPVQHAFDFTPSFSFFIDCASEDELDRLVASLGDGGNMLMPPDDYGFSRKFAWLNDRFKVSWQLNLGAVAFEPPASSTEAG